MFQLFGCYWLSWSCYHIYFLAVVTNNLNRVEVCIATVGFSVWRHLYAGKAIHLRFYFHLYQSYLTEESSFSATVAVGLYGNDDVHNAFVRLSTTLRAVQHNIDAVKDHVWNIVILIWQSGVSFMILLLFLLESVIKSKLGNPKFSTSRSPNRSCWG